MWRSMLTAAAVALTAAPLAAQGRIEQIERPMTVMLPRPAIVRTASTVQVAVDGRIARVHVEEQFRNVGGAVAEGTYLYPLPGEAVFSNFSLRIGDQDIRGEMMPASEARGIYEDIVRRLRDPALLTLEGHGLIRARVFPIQPGETRKVVLEYTQLLPREGDALRFRYTIGNRGVRQARGDEIVDANGSFSLDIAVPDSLGVETPYSPTHTISTRHAGGRTIITVDPDAAGDLELFLPLTRGLVGTSLLAHADPGEDGYFMLLIAPPAATAARDVPRDLTLVVDVSGSMSGAKLEQARAALLQALGTLHQGDRFQLIAFSGDVHRFRPGYAAATTATLDSARDFVNALQAGGGTNIAGALAAALGSASAGGHLPLVVFLTDGLPSVGERAPDRIADDAGARVGQQRIFTVGVGEDVNTYLLDRLAREGRGSAEYIPAGGDVEVAVGGLLGKIQHPALVNLHLVHSPVNFVQSYPATLPDLFYGEELVVFGRYHGSGAGQVVVEGERDGRRERFTVDARFPESAAGGEFIPRLWAARRIGDLTRQIRLEGASPAIVSEIQDLGLRYGILTEYTSYLVQEPGAHPEMGAASNTGGPAGPGARGNAFAAPAPSAQTGAVAFERAEASSRNLAAKTLQQADASARDRMEDLAREAGGAAPVRRLGGRVFALRDSVWTDLAWQDSVRVVDIAPFSDTYFRVVRALPELAPYLASGDRVLIAGRRAGIRTVPHAAAALSDREILQLVRDFRGQ